LIGIKQQFLFSKAEKVFNIIALPVGVMGLGRADFMPAVASDNQPEKTDENRLFVFIRQ